MFGPSETASSAASLSRSDILVQVFLNDGQGSLPFETVRRVLVSASHGSVLDVQPGVSSTSGLQDFLASCDDKRTDAVKLSMQICITFGNIRPQSSQFAEPLWTDPGMKSGISERELISTLKKQNKNKKQQQKAQAGSE